MPASPNIPTYRLHRATGQAVVTVRTATGRRDIYLGRYNSPDSRKEYARVINLLAADPKHFHRGGVHGSTGDPTVSEAVLAYWTHANDYYRDGEGKRTSQVHVVRMALRPLVDLFGDLPVRELGPRELRTILGQWVGRGLARRTVNNYLTAIRVAVKWLTVEGLVPPAVLVSLQAVGSLKKNRSPARETDPRRPVPDEILAATLPSLSRKQRAIAELLRLTGMRPGELVVMRPCDVDRAGPAWAFRPSRHKTAHRGHGRTVWIGPRAQEILAPWLDASSCNEGRVFGLKNSSAIRLAVTRACLRAGIEPWFPYQLRHSLATKVRERFGLGAAGAVLGHNDPEVTTVYARRMEREATEVALQIG